MTAGIIAASGASEELIYSEDFAAGLDDFTGPGVQTTMAAAVGTSKPSYSHVMQHAIALGSLGASGFVDMALLNLATLAEASGRTLTRLVVYHVRKVVHSSAASRTAIFELRQNGVVEFTESIPVAGTQTVDRAWATEEILNPTGTFSARIRNGTGNTTSMPTVTMAITGVELYAI